MEPQRELDGATVLHWARVTGAALSTGRTTHVSDGDTLAPAAALAIARYPDGDGFYLFYLDASSNVMTDTFHESLDGAFDQASFEYVGLEWQAVGS